MARLRKDETIKTTDGKTVKIIDMLGSGGQGVVYKVLYNKKEYALKWYKKSQSEEFFNNLQSNAAVEAPASTFLWPLAVTEKDQDGCFGYIMKLCPNEYKCLSSYLLNNTQFGSLKAMVNAAIQITASFKLLHNRGYSYQDLNDGNFFIEPKNGDVLICDNDNISPNGVNLGILGKPRYMAPEVVSATSKPDTYSDRFSLAVILFLLFFRNHPLEGKKDNCDDENNEKKLFCTNPVFIFDEKDKSNRPNPAVHKNVNTLWPVFPPFVQKEFIKAFDKRLMRSNGIGRGDRIIEKEWLQMLIKLKHSIIVCPNCHEETFFNMKKEEHACMDCDVQIGRPVALKIGKSIIPLQLQQKIYSYEIDSSVEISIENVNQEIGEVIENKKKPGVWGLKNMSDITWYRNTPGGKEIACAPGGVVTIVKENRIKFGTKGEGFLA